ncbi:MAG: ATP-binding cassette domain-containing protein [Verrucomicrobiota bacterium]
MIQLSSVEFQYGEGRSGDFKIASADLKIPSTQSTALIGPSGCGKTTLLHLIAGILPARNGQILINDTRIDQLNDRQRRLFRISKIGFVFQDFALLDYLNLFDNILHPYRINASLSLTREVKDRARSLAEQMGIGEKLYRHPAQTSQGEQQRAAICRALVTQPSIILADEPTGNLDPSNKSAILDILLDHARENQAALIVATHDHDLLPSFDQVVDFPKLIGS